MNTEYSSARTHSLLRRLLTLAAFAWLFGISPIHLAADPGNLTASIQSTQGLVGKQVCLQWVAQPGVQYVVQKSASLTVTGTPGGTGPYKRVALVTAGGTTCQWIDPETPGAKAFYRIEIPAPQVFSLEPPILSSTGGDIFLRAQLLPPGSFLALEIPGQSPVFAALDPVAGQPGVWRASIGGITGGAVAGIVIAARVVDSHGTTVCLVDQTIQGTDTGFATDAPPWLPPAAPVPQAQSNPIPGIGIVVKKGWKPYMGRVMPGPDDDCDGQADDFWLSKKGYDYYKAQADLSSAGAHTNPYFAENNMQGEMPRGAKSTHSLLMPALMKAKEKANRTKCASNLRQTGMASGLPGEITAEQCDLALPCPAGPPLEWVRTYRSKAPLSSSHGPGWDFSYNIYIEPVPLAAGVNATRVVVHDGGGRADTYVRQADGTFRCNGMFREGRFNPDTSFTLTFSDKSAWIFCQLVGAPWSGRIGSITDRNGVSLSFTYNSGQLATVSDAFGRSLSVSWDPKGRIASVSDSTGRSVSYSYFGGEPGGNPGDLKSVSCPQLAGQAPVSGPTTYTYTSGFADNRLNHNLASATDGAGRNVCAFTYSTEVNPTALEFDTVASICQGHELVGNVILIKFEPAPASPGGSDPSASYVVYENDEVGRVTETTFDRQHRPTRVREYTGSATPGLPVTATMNRPAGKLRATDPDYYETTCLYNGQHLCTRVTMPDGLQERTTYEYDLDPACPLRERGNPRVCTLQSPGGEQRTVSMEYLPGFGTCESARKEHEKWIELQGWDFRTGGGGAGGSFLLGSGLKKFDWAPKLEGGKEGLATAQDGSVWDGGEDGDGCTNLARGVDRDGKDCTNHGRPKLGAARGMGMGMGKGMYEWIKNSFDKRSMMQAGGGSVWDGGEDGGGCTDLARGVNRDGRDCTNPGRPKLGHVTRLTTSLGQVFTWGYDASGNCTTSRTPIAGAGCDIVYDALGQVTRVTTLNGPGSSFVDEWVYDPATHFCTSVIRDSPGLHLPRSYTRDALGRITRMVDERGFDWLATYNAADQCVQTRTPLVGAGATASRIGTTYFYDAGGLPSGCDVEHRDTTGALVAANPAYSTRYLRESPSRPRYVTRVAVENRPVSLPPGSTDLASAGVENFDVCDYTYNAAGDCVEERTPGVCLAQPTDIVTSYQFDERGLLYRCIEGIPGTPDAMTTEYDYAPAGNVSRCATLAASGGLPGGENPTTTFSYDGFRRRLSGTDPMGNQSTFSYDNQGYVTCSLYGELDDVPGSTGNVLLARAKITKSRSNIQNNRTAFFDVFAKDDSCAVERFTPGSTATFAQEVTTVDRSPAGLVISLSTNGDLLVFNTYDSVGRQTGCSNKACAVAMTLDASGNVIACTRTDLSTAGGSAHLGAACSVVYDAMDRAVQLTEGSNISTCQFDSFSRETCFQPPVGAPVYSNYDGASTTGAYSVQTQCDVDGDGNLETLGSSYARSCPKSYKIKIDIGPPRPPIFGRSVTNSNGYTTTFTRDSHGRCVQTGYPDGTQESAEFDQLGRRVAKVRKTGVNILYNYNLNGLISGIITGPCKPPYLCDFFADVPATSYRYSGRGDCTAVTQGASDITRAYDSCGNLLSESQNGHLVSHTYTHRGCASTTYPGGVRYNEVRNAQGLLVSCFAEGALGTPIVSVQYQGYRPAQETRANGVVTTWFYRGPNDAALPGTGPDASIDACVQTTVTGPGGVVVSLGTYTRDGSQRLIRRDTRFSDLPITTSPLRRQVITRDRLGRLTRMITGKRMNPGTAIIPESDVAYTLDLEGQRVSATGGSHPGAYSSNDVIPPGDRQMNQYTAWPDGLLEWDNDGSLSLFSHGSSGTHRFTYDIYSRLVAVVDEGTGAAIASYGYDGEDRLISRTVPGNNPLLPPETTFFIYDGGRCIQELDGNGTPQMTFAAMGLCIIPINGDPIYPHGGGAALTQSIKHSHYATSNFHIEVDGMSGGYLSSFQAPSYEVEEVSQCITSCTGAAIERFDADDGGRPVFLTSDGIVRQGATTALTGYRWLAPECIWSPECGLFHCKGGTYSPDLGQSISAKEKPKAKPKPNIAGWDLAVGKG